MTEHFRAAAAGVRLQLADRYGEAIVQYAAALTAAPAWPDILNNQGAALIRTSAYPEAAFALRRATRLAPVLPDTYTNLAVALHSTGDMAAAADAYRVAASLLPTSAETYHRLGDQLRASEGPTTTAALQRAATALAIATRLSPRDADMWHSRGDVALATGDRLLMTRAGWSSEPEASVPHAEAVRAFSRALRLASADDDGAVRSASCVGPSCLYSKLATAAHRLTLTERPEGLAPLLASMRQLQLAADDTSVVLPISSRGDGASPPGRPSQPTATLGWPLASLAVGFYDGAELGAQAVARRQTRQQRSRCSVRVVKLRHIGVGAEAGGGGGSGGDGGGRGGVEEEGSVARDEAVWSRVGGGGGGALLAAFATPLYVARLGRREGASLNAQLLDELLERQRKQPSESHSNAGGWQSRTDLLDGSDAVLGPVLARLRTSVLEAAGAMMSALHARAAGGAGASGGGRDGVDAGGGGGGAAVRLTILNAWANVNGAGHSNQYHDHPQALLSGIYFVADGSDGREGGSGSADGGGVGKGESSGREADGDGSLELVDPRLTLRTHRPPAKFEPACKHLGGGMGSGGDGGHGQLRPGYLFEHSPPLHVPAQPGSFVLFPAWLMHRVRPHGLPRHRVSVSFNLWASDEAGGAGGSIEEVRRAFEGAFYVR